MLEAVLLHERAYICRRDLVTHAAVQVIACLLWFQPLVWPLRRRLRGKSEFACDVEALSSGFGPSECATHLLKVRERASC